MSVPARSSDMASAAGRKACGHPNSELRHHRAGRTICAMPSFPKPVALVVDDGSRRIVYDTGTHRISGVSQQQSGPRSLRFQSQDGDVRLDDLTVVE